MIHYQATMQHTEQSFKALAHMQYDLFSKRNLIARTAISAGAMIVGVLNFEQWWGALLIVYAAYLHSSKYASADHKAGKIVKALKASDLPFPCSRYLFRDSAMEVIAMPENVSQSTLVYADIHRLGEDDSYYYLFRDALGGYMIPKDQLAKQEDAFRAFLETKSGQRVNAVKMPPIAKFLRRVSNGKKK